MLMDVENPFIRRGGGAVLKGSIGWDWKCQHFCPLIVTFLSQAWPMRQSVSRFGWKGSHCWMGTGKGMWFPERFPASTWEWSSWKRHGAGSTSLLRNTSNPLARPNVITALTLLLQSGEKSFFQLAAVISPFWSHTFSETWKSCGLTCKPAHKGCCLGTSLPALITKSFWRCQECFWQQKNELKDVFFYLTPSLYLLVYMEYIATNCLQYMTSFFLLSVVIQYLDRRENSVWKTSILPFDVANFRFGRILLQLQSLSLSPLNTLHCTTN